MKEYIDDSRKASEEDEVIGMYDKELHEERLRKSELREANENGRSEGIKEGIQQGKKEKAKETALKLLQKNIDLNIISECTGLSFEELQKLK